MKRNLKDFLAHLFIPHQGNNFRPKLVSVSVIVFLLALVILIEGAYIVDKRIVFTRTDFLASVLPGVLISLTNADREQIGVEDLTPNKVLTEAAQAKADDMAAKGYFAHITPDGREPWYFLDQAGYHYALAGENLAVNFEDSQDVEQAWMNSPAHRANIVKPQYTEIGIAVAKGEYKGKNATFVVQFFAAPAATASVAPSPVAEAPQNEKQPSASGGQIAGEQVAQKPVTVLPAQAPTAKKETAPAPTAITKAIAAPEHTVTDMLLVIAVLAGVLFLLALIAHMRMPYLEALGGTFALLVIVVGVMLYNAHSMPQLEVPTDTTAAAIQAF